MRRHVLSLVLGISLVPLAAGCQGKVDVSGEETTTSTTGTTDTTPETDTIPQPPAQCPESSMDGKPCSEEGASCKYETDQCTLTFVCVEGQWSIQISNCMTECGAGNDGDACFTVGETCLIGDECGGEAWTCGSDHRWYISIYDSECCFNNPTCPSDAPPDGASCDPCYDASPCGYDLVTACGAQTVEATCGDDYLWHVTEPSPCGCAAHDTIEACAADPECRFLAGGCDAPTLDQGACFPKTDCSPDMPCPDGQTCTTANVNDCGLDACVECVTASVCL